MNPQQYPQQYPGPPPSGPYPSQPGPAYPGAPQPGYGPQPAPQPQNPMMGYNPYAYPGEYAQPPRKKGPKKLLLGIFAVIIIASIIVAVLATGSKDTPPPQTAQTETSEQSTSNAGADVVPRSDGQLDLSKRIVSSKTLKAQIIKATSKEQINLSSGFSFMVNQLEDYVSPNPATKAAAGKKFVVATLAVGNRNQTGTISLSYLDFRLRDDSNQLVAGHVTTNEILSNRLSNPSELKPGEQLNGKIVFEVDAADKEWVLKHSETYQKTTDNTTFNVEGEIVVSLAVPTTESSPVMSPATGTTPEAAPPAVTPAP